MCQGQQKSSQQMSQWFQKLADVHKYNNVNYRPCYNVIIIVFQSLGAILPSKQEINQVLNSSLNLSCEQE